MKASVLLLVTVIFLGGCHHFAARYSETNRYSVSNALLHAWVDCARKSYANFEPEMKDKNEAAERALEACRTEEADVEATSPPILAAHTREAVKQVLINHEDW